MADQDSADEISVSVKVLHIGKYYPPVRGGMERFLSDLVTSQRSAGLVATALVHADSIEERCGDPDWIERSPTWFTFAFAPISPNFPLRIARAIRRWAPDILHLHMPNLSALGVLLLPQAHRVPWIVHWHSDVEPSRIRPVLKWLYPFYRVFEQAILERAAAIIVSSPQYLEASKPLRKWVDRCHVIPLGIPLSRLPALDPHSGDQYWPNGDKFRLLAIGRLTYYKGFETLIQAVAGVADWHLVLVGDGEDLGRLQAQLDDLGNPANIVLLGAVDDHVCNRLLASCNLFCLPSRERTEAFGIVLMEAMRYGKPVLASNLAGSGISWVIQDGLNGRLVPPEDVLAWQAAILHMATHKDQCDCMGSAGERRVYQEMEIDLVRKMIDQVYESVLGQDQDSDKRWYNGERRGVLVVIPALNEAASIAEVVRAVLLLGIGEVLVVDDGSEDDTVREARRAGASVITATLSPQGAWGATQTGIRYAVQAGYTGVVTLDADGQHEPAYIGLLLAASNSANVVIGAFPQRGSFARRVAWAWFRRISGFCLSDLTSGFRFYDRSACVLLAGTEATLLDYQDIGVLLLLRQAGLEIKELAVTMSVRRSGKSKVFSSWRTVVRYMLETTLLCAARWGKQAKSV